MPASDNTSRERIHGIGGTFIYARDPEALVQWYRKHLGIDAANEYNGVYYHQFKQRDHANPDHVFTTTWSIFPALEDAMPEGRGFMLNYHVANLAVMVEQLREDGIEVEKVEEYDYGDFAWITDPEGNRIELYQEKRTPED
ncbi:MAG TPA: VOC family protein [Rhodothermales bacterium]|nr:VOC family protein [Rhodothermales bacterium]